MSDDRVVTRSLSMPQRVYDRLEEYKTRQEQETGFPVSRSSAAAKLIERALDAEAAKA